MNSAIKAERPWRLRKALRGPRVAGVPFDPVYEPTAEEIERACQAIRQTWSAGEHERRRSIVPEVVNGRDPLAVYIEAKAALEGRLFAIQMGGAA